MAARINKADALEHWRGLPDSLPKFGDGRIDKWQQAGFANVESETGLHARLSTASGSFAGNSLRPLPAPAMIDVLSSLLMESDVLNYPSFDDWAESFGYDVDSRKAEKMYQDCMRSAVALRCAIGSAAIEKLAAIAGEL
jgi:hypothetical protein